LINRCDLVKKLLILLKSILGELHFLHGLAREF